MVLEVAGITQQFNGRNILENCSFKLHEGEYISLVGKSGTGKTTLLNIVTGMLKPQSGTVSLDGNDIYNKMSEHKRTKLRADIIGYMNCAESLLESLTVYENIYYALRLNKKKKSETQIVKLLEQLYITNVKDSYPNQISSGEYRRACLARVLALDTKFLILDEPTSNLDDESAQLIADIILSHKEKGVLTATHDSRLMCGTNKIVISSIY